MQIFVVRHAIAAPREGWQLDDGLRPITARGRRRFRRVVESLDDADEHPEVILTSPLVRAVQTAELLAGSERFDGEVEIALALEPERPAQQALAAARARRERSVALVGHEPQVSALAARILGAPLPVPFKKGMVIAFTLGPRARKGELRLAVVPGHQRPVGSLDELARLLGGAE